MIEIVCQLFEAGLVRRSQQAMIGSLGIAFGDLVKIGAIQPAEVNQLVDCEGCFADHSCAIEFDSHAAGWFYHCPESGRIEASNDQILCWTFNVGWFLRQMASALALPEHRHRCLLEDRLWDLGAVTTGSTSWSAMVGRSIRSAQGIDMLAGQLSRRSVDPAGLILIGRLDLPGRIPLPRGHRLASVEKCFDWRDDQFVLIDRAIGQLLRDQSDSSHTGGRRGRPSADLDAILEILRGRVARGDAVLVPKRLKSQNATVNKLREAEALFKISQEKWPDCEPPAINTIRKRL